MHIGTRAPLRLTGASLMTAAILSFTLSLVAQTNPATRGRAITISDMIEMTRAPDFGRFEGDTTHRGIAHFSPDGKHFLIVLQSGNVLDNRNDFRAYLFDSETLSPITTPSKPIIAMASSSNRDAIRDIKWLDNDRFAFLGETPDQPSQVYTYSLSDQKLRVLTHHPTSIVQYDITPDARLLIFTADIPAGAVDREQTRRNEIVVSRQDLSDLLAGACATSWEKQLFVQSVGEAAVNIPIKDAILEIDPVSLSPDGRYGVVTTLVRDIPEVWKQYRSDPIQRLIAGFERWKVEYSPLGRNLLVDTRKYVAKTLLNSPVLGFTPVKWAANSRAVLIRQSYFPVEQGNPRRLRDKLDQTADLEVQVPSGTVHTITERDWPKNPNPPLEVTLEQDLNVPPKIYFTNSKTQQKQLLLDLNPQFASLSFGSVEILKWRVGDIELEGGLYLPPDYRIGKRYPLVIQTHGFEPREFSMDGRSEWSSGFAARALAARGIIVLQAFRFHDQFAEDRIASGADKRWGKTTVQSFRKLSTLAYERAIDALDRRGLIDRTRVGIVGFSRTFSFVGYALTHSKHRFAAASLVDGIDAGYFQYLVFPSLDAEQLNGGKAPFSRAGLQLWLRESPSFNLDKVQAPLRLVALQPFSPLECWEWFVGLRLQHKPVELIELPDASHLLVKPWEREVAQGGLVDWFAFWLKGEANNDPKKSQEFARWRRLSNLTRQSH